MYLCNLFNADEIDSSKCYIILDDFDIDFFPSWKPWFGGQKQFTVTDKYRKKKRVMWGKPMIWLCNEGYSPFDSKKMSKGDSDWLAANTVYVNIGDNKFY